MRRLRRRPDGEDHRQARALEPETAEVVVWRRILEGGLQRGVADQQLRLRVLAERHQLCIGERTRVRTTDVADSGVTATVRIRSSGDFEISWIDSTAPSLETQRRGSSLSESAFRAYSIDEIGATSSSPAIACG